MRALVCKQSKGFTLIVRNYRSAFVLFGATAMPNARSCDRPGAVGETTRIINPIYRASNESLLVLVAIIRHFVILAFWLPKRKFRKHRDFEFACLESPVV